MLEVGVTAVFNEWFVFSSSIMFWTTTDQTMS